MHDVPCVFRSLDNVSALCTSKRIYRSVVPDRRGEEYGDGYLPLQSCVADSVRCSVRIVFSESVRIARRRRSVTA